MSFSVRRKRRGQTIHQITVEKRLHKILDETYNRAGNPFPFDLEELSQAVDRDDNLPVNQRVILG
jgi:hypothetical protein